MIIRRSLTSQMREFAPAGLVGLLKVADGSLLGQVLDNAGRRRVTGLCAGFSVTSVAVILDAAGFNQSALPFLPVTLPREPHKGRRATS